MTVSQLRTIPLLNMEGNILLSVNANHTTRYMLTNNNVDIAVRTGGVRMHQAALSTQVFPNRLVDRLEKKK